MISSFIFYNYVSYLFFIIFLLATIGVGNYGGGVRLVFLVVGGGGGNFILQGIRCVLKDKYVIFKN